MLRPTNASLSYTCVNAYIHVCTNKFIVCVMWLEEIGSHLSYLSVPIQAKFHFWNWSSAIMPLLKNLLKTVISPFSSLCPSTFSCASLFGSPAMAFFNLYCLAGKAPMHSWKGQVPSLKSPGRAK